MLFYSDTHKFDFIQQKGFQVSDADNPFIFGLHKISNNTIPHPMVTGPKFEQSWKYYKSNNYCKV